MSKNPFTEEELEIIYQKARERINASDFSMPRLPELVTRIDTILQDPNMGIQDIADVVKIDPVLSARIIQISNSPLVRGYNRICSLTVAIQRIGINFLRNLVFCMSMHDKFVSPNTELHTVLTEVWDHSINVMMYSYVLAKHLNMRPDTAMIAGILHDIGKLPLLEMSIREEWNVKDGSLCQIMNSLHTRIGGEMLREWDMASDFIDIAKNHHNLYESISPELTYVDIVTVADAYGCKECHYYRDTAIEWDKVPALKKMKLTKDSMEEIFESAEEEINSIRDAMFE